MKRAFYWFRNDLRLGDSPALQRALRENDEIVPVYIFDDREWEEDEWGFVKTGAHRTKFLLQCVSSLQGAVRDLGSELIIKKGNVAEVFKSLKEAYSCNTIYFEAEHTFEELQTENRLADFKLIREEGKTLFHPDDLPYGVHDIPDIFTSFRKDAEKKSRVRPSLPEPESIKSPEIAPHELPTWEEFPAEAPNLDPRAVLEFEGGIEASWERLDHYFFESKQLGVYKKTRNGLLGEGYSSKFSPWLAKGCFSSREIYEEVRRYESEHGANDSTYWLIFELIWRDYFRFVAMKYGERIFWKSGIKAEGPGIQNKRSFSHWVNGSTKDPFVNANMKELAKTGWMSNRGRQNVASYLVHDLGVDWRMGAAWFEHQLLDYDPCSNYGNWIYIAGVGNDPRPQRKFNTHGQAERYDPDGKYQRLWNNEVLEFDL